MTRAPLVALWVILALASRAAADPVFTIEERSYERVLSGLEEQHEEPVGLRVTTPIPQMGLERGDVLLAINGARVSRASSAWGRLAGARPAWIHLTVLRGDKQLVLTGKLTPASVEERVDRARFFERLALGSELSQPSLTSITKGGAPSGVLNHQPWPQVQAGPLEGDLIRRIDGRVVTTPAEVIRALEAAHGHPKLVLDLERAGQPFKLTIAFFDAPAQKVEPDKLAAQVKKLDDRTYALPPGLVDQVVAEPSSMARSARLVPSVSNGRIDGFKLYAIRPGSLFAALGLENGDKVYRVNDQSLESAEAALTLYARVRNAKLLRIELLRRGQVVTLEWRLR